MTIQIKDASGNLVDADGTTPNVIDPYTITINSTDTLADIANQIATTTQGKVSVEFVSDPDDEERLQMRLKTTTKGQTISIQGDTSGIMSAMMFPITDPSLDLTGGASSRAIGTFEAGEENTDFITPNNPNFSAVFPGPPPSVIGEGSFEVYILDATGAIRDSQTITISDGGNETISDIATLLDGMADLTATISPDGELEIEAENDTQFFFRNDETGLISALGLDSISGHGELG